MEVDIETHIRSEITVFASGQDLIFKVSDPQGGVLFYGMIQGNFVASSDDEESLKRFLGSNNWIQVPLCQDVFKINEIEKSLIDFLDDQTEIKQMTTRTLELEGGLIVRSNSSEVVEQVLNCGDYKCFRRNDEAGKLMLDKGFEARLFATAACLKVRYGMILFNKLKELTLTPHSVMIASLFGMRG